MMKRRYANWVEGDYSQKRIDEDYFKGYVCNIKIKGVSKPLIVNNGINEVCIKDENYEWFEVYPDNSNYVITIMFDDNKNLIKWYFDISKYIGIENGIPFEDDLYLDMIIFPNGQKLVLDEDELIDAFNRGEITQSDVDLAYQTIKKIENIYVNNFDDLVKLTNKFYKKFNNEIIIKKEVKKMIGISVAAKKEWEATLNYFGLTHEECEKYPFGEYFKRIIDNQEVILYLGGVRKMNASASTQYMIDHFNLTKIIIAGTCAGIDDNYNPLDIFIPNKAVQYDCTVKETEPLIKDSFTVLNNFENESILTGTIGTADKPVVMWKDYLELKENNITIADTESAAITYVCRANGVECIVIKGISDFPKNEAEISNEESHEEQLNTFLENIPKIMTKIYDHYLVYALRTSINYQKYESKPTTIKK